MKTNANGAAPIDEQAVVRPVKEFEPLWEVLSQAERGRIIRLLVDGVTDHLADQEVEIRFRPSGFTALLEETP